jgi:2-polyprenyl-3-methyl-5-hydroxy-6-metoxy-1,4-benzoquinol methylase
MTKGLKTLFRYWFPPAVDRDIVGPQLDRFYRERADYHAMTDNDDKLGHPQVRLLLSLLSPSDKAVEFGCGGGTVLATVGAKVAAATGIDIGEMALARARSRPGKHRVIRSDVAHVPLPSGYADVVYSLEVLEHVWDPAAMIKEMFRVARPEAMIFFTTPNGYDLLYLHRAMRPFVGLLDGLFALLADVRAWLRRAPYENIPPDLDANPVYPDCDMISRLHPRSLLRFARDAGCKVERLETFFFLREKAASETERRRYERFDRQFFYRWHGDHILFVGRR